MIVSLSTRCAPLATLARRPFALALLCVLTACASPRAPSLPDGPAPQSVRMTYFGISNWMLQIGSLNILVDGYMTRIPKDYFSGGGGGLAVTKAAWPIDRAAVDRIDRVLTAPPGQPIDLILSGHSHFDHSFDTPYWAKLTGAPVIGPKSTCLQIEALGVPSSRCTAVDGGETIRLNAFVTMRVVLWNHSGTDETNPEQHDPVELTSVPKPDAAGNLRGGVAEDYPNGGGSRGYLFTVDTASGRSLRFFVTNSASPADLDRDTLVNGTVNRGSPLASLERAMADAKITGVDLWLATGGVPVASLVVPILHPAVYMPNHLGSFFVPFERGLTPAFDDPPLLDAMRRQSIAVVVPRQYLDAFVLDTNGVRPVDNAAMKARYGF